MPALPSSEPDELSNPFLEQLYSFAPYVT
jgi:hypothetical protein